MAGQIACFSRRRLALTASDSPQTIRREVAAPYFLAGILKSMLAPPNSRACE